MPPKDPANRQDERLRYCHCGIYCKRATQVSDETWRRHQEEVAALHQGSSLPPFRPASAALQALFDATAQANIRAAEQHASSSQKRPSTGPRGSGSKAKRRRAGKEAEVEEAAEDEPVRGADEEQGADSSPWNGSRPASRASGRDADGDDDPLDPEQVRTVLLVALCLLTRFEPDPSVNAATWRTPRDRRVCAAGSTSSHSPRCRCSRRCPRPALSRATCTRRYRRAT